MHDTLKSPPSFPAESPLAQEWQGGKGRFLIDGFPRKMDQAIKFDETVRFWVFLRGVFLKSLTWAGLQILICPLHQHYRRGHARSPA